MSDTLSNSESIYINLNQTKTFNQTITTDLTQLSSQVCSEVTVINRTGSSINVFDQDRDSSENGMLLKNDDTFTFRGVTNSDQLSAQTTDGSGPIYYRTAFYSMSISR